MGEGERREGKEWGEEERRREEKEGEMILDESFS